MDGIQIIRLLDLLPITGARNAKGVSPRSLIITGTDFRNVEQVIMDGFVSPFFVVHSPTELVAEVPSPLIQSVITSISVLSNSLTMTGSSLVEFTFGTRPKRATGVIRLMQTFLRILLRSPGSNRFHPRSGGGLLKRVGTTISKEAAADVAVAVQTARQYLINVQTASRNIAPSERLLSAEIQALDVNPGNTSIFVTIVLTSHSGARSAATIQA